MCQQPVRLLVRCGCGEGTLSLAVSWTALSPSLRDLSPVTSVTACAGDVTPFGWQWARTLWRGQLWVTVSPTCLWPWLWTWTPCWSRRWSWRRSWSPRRCGQVPGRCRTCYRIFLGKRNTEMRCTLSDVAHAHARTHARTHAHTHARTHAHAHRHTQMHARTHTRPHTRPHTHTHTHTPPLTNTVPATQLLQGWSSDAIASSFAFVYFPLVIPAFSSLVRCVAFRSSSLCLL